MEPFRADATDDTDPRARGSADGGRRRGPAGDRPDARTSPRPGDVAEAGRPPPSASDRAEPEPRRSRARRARARARPAEPEPAAEPEPEPRAASRGRGGDRRARAGHGRAPDLPRARARGRRPAPAEPTTVAELVAATLRAAGVRIAFTVAGESFLGDPRRAGRRRDPRRRHPPRGRRRPRRRGLRPAHRPARAVPRAPAPSAPRTSPSGSTPPPPTRRRCSSSSATSTAGYRGREAFQEVDLVATIGGLAKWAGRIDDPATAAERARGGRPRHGRGPARPGAARHPRGRPGPAASRRAPGPRSSGRTPRRRPAATCAASSTSSPRPSGPLILAGAGVLRARCSNDLVRFAELLHVPVIASWRRGDVIPNDHPLYLGMAGFGSPRGRARAARSRPTRCWSSGRASTSRPASSTRSRRWASAGCTWTSSPGPARSASRPRRSSRSAPTPAPSCGPPTRASRRRCCSPSRSRPATAHNAEDRAAWEAAAVVDDGGWSGPGVHPGRIIADLRRLLPDDAIVTTDAGAFGGWAARGFRFRKPGTFLGPTSGAMGYGVPGGARRRARPPRAAGRRARRRRRDGHDPRRGRDGRPRGRPRRRDRVRQRALRDDPRPPGPAGQRHRARDGPRAARLRRRRPGPAAPAASGSRATRRSRARSGPRSPRPARRSSR